MKRLTGRRESGAWPKKGWTDEGIAECLDRLATIEDILGDEYELDRLRELVEADRVGHCVVFDLHYPVVFEYYKDEDGRFIRETSGVVFEAEAEAALKAREQDEQ